MTKKLLILASFLFIASVLIMPLAMSNCGTNGFHMGFQMANSFCGTGTDLGHISFMRGLVFIGLAALVIVLLQVIFNQRLFSLSSNLKKAQLEKFKISSFNKKSILGRMKPFDKLLMAYADGLVQPKTFCIA